MKNSIAILGCGWLGMPLAKYFFAMGKNIHASTTTASKLLQFNELGYKAYHIDIENIEDIDTAFFDVETLIICITNKNIEAYKQLNQLIENSPVKKVLYVSSTSVYKNLSAVLNENAELSNSPLVAIEKVFLNSKSYLSTVIRFSGLFSKDRHPGRFFKNGRIIPNPDAPVNMIHRDDCILIIADIINENAWSNIFNACADTHPSRREFYLAANKNYGSEAPNFNDDEVSVGKEISNKHLKETLAFNFIHPDVIDALGK